MKRFLILLAKFGLAGGLFWYLFSQGDIDFTKLGEIENWAWIILAQVLVLVLLCLTALRWYLLLKAQGIEQSYKEVFILGSIGFYFNQFMPGSVGGDLMKAYYIAVDHPERRAPGVTTVFLDRVFGLMVLMAIGGGAILFNLELVRQEPMLQFLSTVVVGGLLGVLCFSLLFFNQKVRSQPWLKALLRRLPFSGTLRKIEQAVYTYRHHPRVVILAFLISVGVQASVVLINVCFFYAIGGSENVSLAVFFLTIPLVHLAMAVPISPPGGLGVGEVAMTELLKLVGYGQGFTLAIFQRLSWYLWALVGLFFYLKRKKKVQAAMEEVEKDQSQSSEKASLPVEPLQADGGDSKPISAPVGFQDESNGRASIS